MEKICPVCGEKIKGRSDKKFCSIYCKSAYQYKQNLDKAPGRFKQIDSQLKLNRRILKEYNKAGKAIVRKSALIKEGFNPNFFTNYWKNSKGEAYLFCYEYGFLSRIENGKEKYVLVQWQEYMEKKS